MDTPVRAVEINGEAWLVGKDVAEVLGYKNTRDALGKHVDKEDKMLGDGVAIRDSIGRKQKPLLINESGLYSLVLRSKLPNAKKFRRWVTKEVLPQIRQTGGYIPVQEGKLNEQIVNGFINEFENSPTNWGKNGYIIKWDIVGKELNFSQFIAKDDYIPAWNES